LKKLAVLICVVLILTAAGTGMTAAADQRVDVYDQQKELVKSVVFVIGIDKYFVNGDTTGVKMDAKPFIEQNRTFVPVRYLGYALGVTPDNVKWSDELSKATLTRDSNTVEMVIGSKKIITNGEAKEIDVAPLLRNWRTYLPARFVAESLGYIVDWDPKYPDVVLCYPKGTEKPDVSTVIKQIGGELPQEEPTVKQEYKDVNGYKVPLNTDLYFPPAETVDISILILLNEPLDEQYQDLHTILTSKFDNQVIDEVLNYVKQKKDRKQDLPLKKWSIDNYAIEVAGQDVNIQVLIRK